MSRRTYKNNGYTATDCPLCGQEVRVDRHGDRFRFSCRGGCEDSVLSNALDPAVMLDLARPRTGRRVVARTASSITPEPVRFVWEGRWHLARDQRARRHPSAARHTAPVPRGARGRAEPRQLAAQGVGPCGRGRRGQEAGQGLRLAFDVRVQRARRRHLGVRAGKDHGHERQHDRAPLRDSDRGCWRRYRPRLDAFAAEKQRASAQK